MDSVLIIDDDELFLGFLSQVIAGHGCHTDTAMTLRTGLEKAYGGNYSIIFLDIGLPDGSGLDILKKLKEAPAEPEVIIITGAGDPDGAELAITTGAWDYLEKPFSRKKVELVLLRTLEYCRKKTSETDFSRLARMGIIGKSSGMKHPLGRLLAAGRSDINVLITGETGTGKEVFARAVHDLGARAEKPFIVVDCAALPESLVDSVLFGHTKGAFTGADAATDGLVKLADGGTLFMDEVGELPLRLQKKFLRVLQEKRFLPVGGRVEQTSDFRLISATNRDLEEGAKQGSFRKDLLFRLQAFSIDLPPLRERDGDLPLLVRFYFERALKRFNLERKSISDECLESLMKYDWPGNVRELFNSLESAIVSSGNDSVVYSHYLPVKIKAKIARASVVNSVGEIADESLSLETVQPLKAYRESMEKQYLVELIALAEGNTRKACEASGLSQSRFYSLLKKYGVSG